MSFNSILMTIWLNLLSKRFYILFYNSTKYHKYVAEAFTVPCKPLLNGLKTRGYWIISKHTVTNNIVYRISVRAISFDHFSMADFFVRFVHADDWLKNLNHGLRAQMPCVILSTCRTLACQDYSTLHQDGHLADQVTHTHLTPYRTNKMVKTSSQAWSWPLTSH